jgi:hypothetical protein
MTEIALSGCREVPKHFQCTLSTLRMHAAKWHAAQRGHGAWVRKWFVCVWGGVYAIHCCVKHAGIQLQQKGNNGVIGEKTQPSFSRRGGERGVSTRGCGASLHV